MTRTYDARREWDWMRETQSIRFRRVNWLDANQLGDELYTIFSAAREYQTGPIQINGDFEDPFTTTSLPSLNIPALDFEFPHRVSVPEESFPDGSAGSHVESAYTWHRTQVYAKVTSFPVESNGVVTCTALAYPHADMVSLRDSKFGANAQGNPETIDLTCEVLQGTVGIGEWVWVQRVVELLERRTTTRNAQGGVITQNTTVEVVQAKNTIIGASGAMAVVASEISAFANGVPGRGRATIQDFTVDNTTSPPTPSLSSGRTVWVYSNVDDPIESGKRIQMKLVSGEWVVDVEDCD